MLCFAALAIALVPGVARGESLDGSTPAAGFGSALASADMDGDGLPELVVGAPLADVATPAGTLRDAGEVRVVSGADQSVLSSFSGTAAGEGLGSALAIVPDQNADGFPDLLVGSPLADRAELVGVKTVVHRDAGRVALYSGVDGALLATLAEGAAAGDRFGAALAVGDLDGAGGLEAAVGVPGFDAPGAAGKPLRDAGRVIVYVDLLLSSVDYTLPGEQARERFGSALAIDAAGHRLLVGAPGFDATSPAKRGDAGRVAIYPGTYSSEDPLLEVAGEQKGERLGSALASFDADLDGDGFVDWAAGGPGADVPNAATGKLAKDAGQVRLFSSGAAGTVLRIEGEAAGDRLGSALAIAEGDLAAGAPGRDVAAGGAVLRDAGRVTSHGDSACTMRTSVDRPDDQPGLYQMRVWYVLPADGIDLQRDLDGSIRTSVESFTAWMEDRTGGRAFRIDRCEGLADIGFVRLDETDAELNDGDTLHNLGAAMLAEGLLEDDRTINLVYYEGTNDTCGNASNPSVPGQFSLGVIYLNGAYPDPNVLPCNQNPLGASLESPGYLDLAMLHEAFHQSGAVPSCAPHHANNHVGDDPTDLMYAGPLPSYPDEIDPGHDDYFDTGSAACYDVAKSPFLEPLPAEAVPPPNW